MRVQVESYGAPTMPFEFPDVPRIDDHVETDNVRFKVVSVTWKLPGGEPTITLKKVSA
jgi:hypothetical protein